MKFKYLLIPVFAAFLLPVWDGFASSVNGDETGQEQTSLNVGKYPEGISVTEFYDEIGSDGICHGFVVTVDFKENPNLRFSVTHTIPYKVPTEIFSDFDSERGKPCVLVNGGYFSTNGTMRSVSLAIADGTVKAVCDPTSTGTDGQTVYPVRSALGQMPDGSFEAHWVYAVDYPSSMEQYRFPSALNDGLAHNYITEPPTRDTAGAEPWNPKEAIGGGPRLVLDGKNVADENYWNELLDLTTMSALSRHPRTAIGYTADNVLIMIVCDGRGMNDSIGFTCSELADKFISLGATDAVNIDGGGSSQIVGSKGEILNRPSDTHTSPTIVERAIPTALVISELE